MYISLFLSFSLSLYIYIYILVYCIYGHIETHVVFIFEPIQVMFQVSASPEKKISNIAWAVVPNKGSKVVLVYSTFLDISITRRGKVCAFPER